MVVVKFVYFFLSKCALYRISSKESYNIVFYNAYQSHKKYFKSSSLQCYSVLSDILVKNELCIPYERGSNVLPTGEGFICLSPPSKLKIAVRFCSIYKKTISFSAIVF